MLNSSDSQKYTELICIVPSPGLPGKTISSGVTCLLPQKLFHPASPKSTSPWLPTTDQPEKTDLVPFASTQLPLAFAEQPQASEVAVLVLGQISRRALEWRSNA